MNILTALKTTLTAFPQVERRIALAQFLSRYINTKVRITNYRCVGKDADAIDTFLRNIGMDESVYTIVRSKFDNDTALIKWNTDNQEKIFAFTKSISQAITVNSLTQLYSGIVLEPNEESVAQDISVESPREHWSKNIQAITENILGDGVHAHFTTLGEIERYAWSNNLIDSSVKLPPVPLFIPKKDSYVGSDVAVRYMRDTDHLKFMPGLTSAPLRALLAATSERNPLNNFLYQTKDALSGVDDLPTRDHLLVTTTGWVNTTNRLDAMRIIEFISNSKDLWAYISMLFRVVYKVHCTVTPWSRVAVNNLRSQGSSGIYPAELKDNGGWGEIGYDVDNIEGANHLAVFASVILTPQSVDSGNTPALGYTNVQDVTPVPLTSEETSQSTGEAVDDRAFLDKRDLGGEWFATVHGLDMIVDATGTPEKRIENFRTTYSELNPTHYTKVPLMCDLESSNPVQVFTSGCAIAIRDFFQRIDRVPKFHADAVSIISDMYSGIVTDGSASMVDCMCGEKPAFPDLKETEAPPSIISSFFSWLDTEEGSKVQLRVAPRNDVARSRLYSITLKTALDADAFISNWRAASTSTKSVVRETIGMSFLNAYVYKGYDPTAAAGLTTPPTEHPVQMLKDLLGEFDLSYPCVTAEDALSQAKVLTPTQLLNFYSAENYSVARTINIHFIKDLENRLYIMLGIPLSFAVTARLMYRASNGLPIATRSLARNIQAVSKTGSLGFIPYVPTSEQDSNVYYDKYIAAIMKDKRLRVLDSVANASRALRDYPAHNIGPTPETSVLMNLWSVMYSKAFLSCTGLNAYPGPDRNHLGRGIFVDIAGDEFGKCLKVKDIVFGTSES